MKKYLFLLVGLIFLTGCSKTDDPKHNPQPQSNDEYYVKYSFTCQIVQYGRAFPIQYTITYIDKDLKEQTRVYKNVETNELICGPFKYKDKIKLKVDYYYEDNSGGSASVQQLLDILISKNNSPFALHKSTNTLVLEDTIDY